MKLKASLPKDELNGLTAVAQRASKLGTKILIVGLVESISITDELNKPKDLKFELLRVEAVPDSSEAFIAGMIEDEFENRTGKTPLDLDVDGAEDLRKRFKPKKPKGERAAPDLFAEPAAIGTGPASTLDDDIVDAEVLDYDDEESGGVEASGEDEDASAPTPEFSDR